MQWEKPPRGGEAWRTRATSTRAPAIREVSVDYSGGWVLDNHAKKPEGTPAEPRAAILERLRREHPA